MIYGVTSKLNSKKKKMASRYLCIYRDDNDNRRMIAITE